MPRGMDLETEQDRAVHLANDRLEAIVRPDLGGRLEHLIDRATKRDVVWHPPGYTTPPSRTLEIGAPFDPHWTGGFEEVFPNDVAGRFRGRMLPDHGELWSQAWDVAERTPESLGLEYACTTVPVAARKVFTLAGDELRIGYRFTNESDEALPFLFKLHAAVRVEPGDRVTLPDCAVEAVDLAFGSVLAEPGLHPFPVLRRDAGREERLDLVHDRDSRIREFFYVHGLAEGSCGIDRSDGTRLRIDFDVTDLPYVWVLKSCGGWEGRQVVLLEPCTNVPYDLETAVRRGSAAELPPRGSCAFDLRVRIA